MVSSRLICDQLRWLSAYPQKTFLLLLHEKSRVLKMKNLGEIVEKPHFAHAFTVILALINYHAPSNMKWSIEFCPS